MEWILLVVFLIFLTYLSHVVVTSYNYATFLRPSLDMNLLLDKFFNFYKNQKMLQKSFFEYTVGHVINTKRWCGIIQRVPGNICFPSTLFQRNSIITLYIQNSINVCMIKSTVYLIWT